MAYRFQTHVFFTCDDCGAEGKRVIDIVLQSTEPPTGWGRVVRKFGEGLTAGYGELDLCPACVESARANGEDVATEFIWGYG